MVPIFFVFLFLNALSAADTAAMVENALDQFHGALLQLHTDLSKVAVYSITTNKPDEVDTVSIQDRIVNMLLESGKYKVVDRASLKALLKEQSLSLTGMVDNAAMIKAGKLIGVEGFFFGNMNLKNDKVVFTIKLIDVASSALVFSKTIIGEAYNRVEIGIAGGFSSGTGFNSNYDYYDEMADIHKLFEGKSTSVNGNSISGPQINLFYIQGFKGLRSIKMGINLSYMKTDDIVKDKKVFNPNEFNPPEYNRSSFGSTVYSSISRFAVTPYILITPGTDLFAITVGGSINFIEVLSEMSSWGENGTQSRDNSLSTIKFFPEIGVDFRPVKYIRLFVRGMYVTSDITFDENIQLSGSGNFSMTQSDITIQQGFIFNMGVGLSYTF
jgi:TolB-like protein